MKYLDSLNEDIVIADPHHTDTVEWKFENDKFYWRQKNTKRWVEMKHIHITKARIVALYKLIGGDKK